jgi:SAM-dependent methyltransferase
LIILKNREVLETYAEVFANLEPRNILEFGIFQGGSPALFSLWFDVERFVAIDICDPVRGFTEFCDSHEVGRKIRTHYRVSQTDHEKIHKIMDSDFGAASIDVIIDDASHLYGPTRRAFEITFPYLRPGGVYVIEDWGWAHWPGSKFFPGQTALSKLIMELTMLCGSRRDLIEEIRIFSSFAFVRKAAHAPALVDMNIDALYSKRGIELVGTGEISFGGVAKVLSEGFSERARRKLKRLTQRFGA